MDTLILSKMLALGILTAVMPCPLATNIATISYLSQSVGSPGRTLAASAMYMAGRVMAYTAIGVLASTSLMSLPSLSFWLQETLPDYLGPLLVLAGMVILDFIRLPLPGATPGADQARRVLDKSLYAGSLVIGLLFALALCPPGAAIFLLDVLPASLSQGPASAWLSIAVFGAGTALPVLAFALLITLSMRHAHALMSRLPKIQRRVKTFTGWGFIGLGLYWIADRILLA